MQVVVFICLDRSGWQGVLVGDGIPRLVCVVPERTLWERLQPPLQR
jgi:hypothetical protein